MASFLSTETDSATMLGAANGISFCITRLQSVRDEIGGGLLPKLQPYWQGDAKDNFEKEITAFAKLFGKFTDDHVKLNERLKKAALEYGKTDESLNQYVSKLSI